MNDALVIQRIPVGVVVERSPAESQWVDYVWRPLAVLTGIPDAAPWTLLSQEGERTQFYAGASEIGLQAGAAAQYRDNLFGNRALWVSLRPTGVEPAYEVVAVTADPAEGESYTQAGDDLVEMVPMPEPVRLTLEAFVAEHYVEQTFFKRKRDRADPQRASRGAIGDDT